MDGDVSMALKIIVYFMWYATFMVNMPQYIYVSIVLECTLYFIWM